MRSCSCIIAAALLVAAPASANSLLEYVGECVPFARAAFIDAGDTHRRTVATSSSISNGFRSHDAHCARSSRARAERGSAPLTATTGALRSS